jgi:aspartokinase
MFKEMIKAYKIVSSQFLTFVRMEFFRGFNSPLGKILEVFQRRSLPIRFLASDVSSKGELTLNLGVDLLSEETIEELIDELRDPENRHELALISQTSMAMIYGPHFGEMPGIAGLTFSALTSAGVTLLAISASSSSLSCLFPSVQFKTALGTLNAIFESPSGTSILME